MLEALGRLCRESEGQHLIELLSQHAPTWLIQMPALLSTAELEALQRKVAGATRERMLRELAEAVEALTAERLLVLWLEDLQWSDVSTLDWLAFLARRHERARLLVLGTYRPVEVIVREHPLRSVKQELQLHGQCAELPLGLLSAAHVAEYLATRFGGGAGHEPSLQVLARTIHQRTDGNPLFMVNVVECLVAHGEMTQRDGQWALQEGRTAVAAVVPESLQQMIEQQIERLRPEIQRMLEVASVAGAEFSAVAAGLATPIEEVEAQCGELARREFFLRVTGTAEWPDGTVAARYGFLHALYQEVVYHRLTARRRQRFHRQIGERAEAAYGDRVREIAAELAMHFERGREYRRAIQYLQQAGVNAVRRSANQEAISLVTRGLELLKHLPDTPERAQQELQLQLTLLPPLMVTRGYAAAELEKVYTRARELSQQVGETPQLISILYGLAAFYRGRAALHTGRELAEQLFTLCQSTQDSFFLPLGHYVMAMVLLERGEFGEAREHAEQGIGLYDRYRSQSSAWQAHHFGVGCLNSLAWVLWVLGYPDQALRRAQEAFTLAQEMALPMTLAEALSYAARFHQNLREWQAAEERAAALVTLCTEQGFPLWQAEGTIVQGWALAAQVQREEGMAQMRQGLVALQAIGVELRQPYTLTLLAEVYGKGGQAEEGLNALSEALTLVNKTGERWYEAELYRLKGELLLQSKVESEKRKEEKQKSKGKIQKEKLPIPNPLIWFTEGFDTADLKEAKVLLEELSMDGVEGK